VKRAEVAQYLREAMGAGAVARNAGCEDAQFERPALQHVLATVAVIGRRCAEEISPGAVIHLATSDDRQYR
jgi:hypothetical protein